ncbi:MAG: transposase [Candidatus Paceibacterota bacterium]|jgi:putative transposase
MSIRKVNFVPGEYYHVYNRGNSKQVIFRDEKDFKHFIFLLYLSNTIRNFAMRDITQNFFNFNQEKQLVSIGAWVLMSNHFHLIITPTENESISKFMQKLTTAYSMYYNKKYKRTGSLFEGKFKSKHIKDDRNLKYLFSYIHLNPIKLIQKDWKEKGIKDKQQATHFLNDYKYSSYQDYLNIESKRPESIILNKKDFPSYFPTKEKFKKEIFEWLSYKDLTP